MLSTSMLKEEIDLIVDLVTQKKTEDARQRLNHLVPEVSSEYGRGAILALNGILNVLDSKNTEKMSDYEKILREPSGYRGFRPSTTWTEDTCRP